MAMSGYTERYSQDFELNTEGWFGGGDYGMITRVESGTNGITSADGGYHAQVEQSESADPSSVYTRFDGYRDDFKGGFTTSVKIYLDQNWLEGTGFSYSVAANGQDANHQRDFIFHVAKDADTGTVLVGASNNASFDPYTDLEAGNHADISESGWYTFTHDFYENELGDLEVSLKLFDADGVELFEEIRTTEADDIATEVGGNRYGWFTNVDIDGGIAIDSATLETADSNPVFVKNGNTILDSFATVADAREAVLDLDDTIMVTTEETLADAKATFEEGDVFLLSGEVAPRGQVGAMRIYGTSGSDELVGGDKFDTIIGLDGGDTIDGGKGRDVLRGKTGQDVLIGNNGADEIFGGRGGDTLSGDRGKDMLKGGSGSDSLDGGDGNDLLIGGKGWDTLAGGEGNDVFQFSSRSGVDVIEDFDVSEDMIQIVSGASAVDDISIDDASGGAMVEFAGTLILVQGVSAEELTSSVFDFA